MPVITAVANTLTKPLPRVLSPKAHAVADYLTIGSLLAAAALFWCRNPKASLGAIVCAGAGLATSLLTDYPGGVAKVISYPTHGKIEIGLAAMMATVPEFLAFNDDKEKKFFLAEAAAVTAVSNLTDFRPKPVRVADRLARMAS
jgi:hypothetical protein